MKEVKAYKCDYCSKLYQRPTYLVEHEKKCNKKPSNKTLCFGCNYIEMKKATITTNDIKTEADLLFCKKLEHYIYPPSVVDSWKGPYLMEDIDEGETENKKIKKECKYYNDEYKTILIN